MKERSGAGVPSLASVAGDALRFMEAEEETDLSRLTDSFHLNLTAFGMLAYLVGLFIVHAAFGLAFEQRLGMVRTMRAVGVSARTLVVAMLCELLMFAALAGAAGMVCGYLIAARLLPDVASSLDGLYGAQVAGRLTLAGQWWISGLAMAVLGALIASASGFLRALRLPVLAAAQPFAWRVAQGHYLRRQALLGTLGLAAALIAFVFGEGLYAGFTVMAGLLLGGALLLPLVLAGALQLGEARASGAMPRWYWADSRQQLPGLSLALMALLLALSTNVGVGAMVEGFRKTFTGWLDERLIAEIYFETTTNAEAQRVEEWLAKRPEVTAILPVWKTKTRIASWPVDVIGLRSHETYRGHFPLMSAAGDAWDRVQRGGGALVSEQLARRLRLGVGDVIKVPTAGEDWRVKVVGVYPDYGNAKGQLRVDLDALVEHWPDVQRLTYSLRAAPGAVPSLIDAMQKEFGPAISRIIDQASVKRLSTGVFERTFAVTAALNSLTLIVSAIALLASLLTLSDLRLAQLAPVWAVGVTRRRLSVLEFSRILLFAGATAVIAVPLGLALAWCLVAVVNVEAFGWRLPFHVFPAQWMQIFALALVTAALAAAAPLMRLARIAPAELLKVFANER
jgi:putative ABC transport system permease protein